MLQFVKLAILPPFLNILLLGAGFLLLKSLPRLGRGLFLSGLATLYLFSIPPALQVLSIGLEDHPVPTIEEASRAEAIVVLGGGREVSAPHWSGQDVVAEAPLARLAEAARWHRKTGLPMLLTGGRNGMVDAESEAQIMNRMLEEGFGLQARWLEHESRTTRENAELSAPILRAAGIETILLVTHAAHLTRAIPEFERQGMNVIPAPMGFTHSNEEQGFNFLPRTYYLLQSTRLLHEQVGRLYYWLTRQ